MKDRGLFDEEERLKVLSKLGDNLETLNKKINWELFRPILKKALQKESKGLGGRPAYDYVMMFKIIILQRLYNISDEQTEYQINDRLSFMRFLGLELKDKVPDAKTIWLFKERLIEGKVSEKLFDRFGRELAKQNLIGKEGTIIDATIVEAPIQHNSKEENSTFEDAFNLYEEDMMAKKLVAFFSASGVTAQAARILAEAAGADVYEIKPAIPYTKADLDWMDKKSRSSIEMADKSSRPAIMDDDAHIADYDVIFVGFPIWWYIAPTIINTFLERYDFSGKKIVLFATSGGSSFGKAVTNLQPSASNAKILEGKLLNGRLNKASLAEWAAQF